MAKSIIFVFLTTEGESLSDISEVSETSSNHQSVHGSFLNLLPPQLEISKKRNESH